MRYRCRTVTSCVILLTLSSLAGADDWAQQVRQYRGVRHVSPHLRQFFEYECVEPEGCLLDCLQNMILLGPSSARFAYSEYTPLEIEYPAGSRPYLEKVFHWVVGDARDDKLKVGRILAWLPPFRPLPEYHGPLPPAIAETAEARDFYYRNPEEWVLLHGHGDCAAHTRVFIILCQIGGIPARMVQLQKYHTTAEVYLDGKWCFCDPLLGKMLLLEKESVPASAYEICQGKKVAWGRVGVALSDQQKEPKVENARMGPVSYLEAFKETCAGNYGYVPHNRRQAMPLFGIEPTGCHDGVDLKNFEAGTGKTQMGRSWTIGQWKPYTENPGFTPIDSAAFPGQGMIAIELVGRYGLRNTVGLFFGPKTEKDCCGLVLYETYGVKLVRCREGHYADLAVADYPTRPGARYVLAVVAHGRKIHGFVNGRHVLDACASVEPGGVYLFNSVESRAIFANLTINPNGQSTPSP